MMAMDSNVCVVCSEPADDSNSSICYNCGQRYHLNQRNDRPGKDCGEVWINEQHLSLEFACALCLKGTPRETPVARPRRRIRTARRRYRKWDE